MVAANAAKMKSEKDAAGKGRGGEEGRRAAAIGGGTGVYKSRGYF